MRIIGGEYRSRLISMPKGVEIRPTMDKVRQAVFNILGDVNGASVLELFAGSGAFGIEAISRGADHATFVDNNFACIKTIKANIASLGVNNSKYDIIRTDALLVCGRFEKEGKRFDIVFMDPPYYKEIAKKCLISIDTCDILSRTALVVVEHFKKDSLPAGLKSLAIEKTRQYADAAITIFRKIS